ncbi:MAG: hypothetical protein F6K61_08005 [Sphaerospermopsis sp. SIO1G1]|nr:hypothetical protein [Sphaerospermopsis sp. SIO1G1]
MNHLLRPLLRKAIALSLAFSLLFYALPARAVSVELSSDIPADISLTLKDEKTREQEDFPGLQEIFDRFAWNEFVAINWPLEDGTPLPKITDKGTPQWLTWHESLQVFRPDGSDPQENTPRLCPQNSDKWGNKRGNKRELYLTSSVFSNTVNSDIADEVNQAFTTPLYDQNGKEVRYEIFLNDEEYDYIVENKLYNLDGQIEYSQKYHAPVNFPSGDYNTGELGAIEIKLAWKELSADDIESRFYTQEVLLPKLKPDGEPDINKKTGNFKSCEEKKMGLVGMHIAQKTKSSPQWVWATFEQVDNIVVDDTVFVDGKRLHASFHDYTAAGQTLPVNVPPIKRNSKGKPDSNGLKKTQVSRAIPITGLAQRVNSEYQQALAEVNSPLQYYELIDTQWPTAPYPSKNSDPKKVNNYGAVAGSPFPNNLPEGITRKSTGAPAPVYLTNSIMETYFQAGNQLAQFQENGFPQNKTPVFGTESCMACHFSAGIATGYEMKNLNGDEVKVPIFDGDLTGDFSWLPQLKAQWKDQIPELHRALAR